MVVALLALFVALGGSSYAAIALKNNSVRSNHIKNGQVKRADLGAGAVDASKVQNGGLLAEDFAAGQLPAGAQGPKGDPGANGQNGANGADGQDGADGADGQDGADGLDGVALVTQARCGNCPRQSVQANAGQPTTMSDGAWTQEPGEGNLLFFEVHWTPPADTCTGAFGATPGAVVQVKLDGIVVAEWRRPTGSGFGVVTDQATPKYVFASATATPHALTFEVRDNCTGSENATVHQLRVDVASAPG